jgi:hypothetical protein
VGLLGELPVIRPVAGPHGVDTIASAEKKLAFISVEWAQTRIGWSISLNHGGALKPIALEAPNNS